MGKRETFEHYFIFDDMVYVDAKFVHPGGKAILDAVNGREIDRFIYGMYPI
jgi:hypothetical protein